MFKVMLPTLLAILDVTAFNFIQIGPVRLLWAVLFITLFLKTFTERELFYVFGLIGLIYDIAFDANYIILMLFLAVHMLIYSNLMTNNSVENKFNKIFTGFSRSSTGVLVLLSLIFNVGIYISWIFRPSVNYSLLYIALFIIQMMIASKVLSYILVRLSKWV